MEYLKGGRTDGLQQVFRIFLTYWRQLPEPVNGLYFRENLGYNDFGVPTKNPWGCFHPGWLSLNYCPRLIFAFLTQQLKLPKRRLNAGWFEFIVYFAL